MVFLVETRNTIGGFQLKKNRTIKKDKEFQLVFKKGNSFANKQLVLYFLEKEKQTRFRIGISVSKKIGNAVVRNRFKRYIRQAFYELDENIKLEYDLIVIARAPVATFDFAQTKGSLLHLLKKTSLYVR